MLQKTIKHQSVKKILFKPKSTKNSHTKLQLTIKQFVKLTIKNYSILKTQQSGRLLYYFDLKRDLKSDICQRIAFKNFQRIVSYLSH